MGKKNKKDFKTWFEEWEEIIKKTPLNLSKYKKINRQDEEEK